MFTVTVDEREYKIEFENDNTNKGKINNNDFLLDVVSPQFGIYHLIKDNQSYNIEVITSDFKKKEFSILINGEQYTVKVQDETDVLLHEMGFDTAFDTLESEIKAPMPGLVLNIIAKEGDNIKKGDPLVVLEAMKMENTLKSPRDGVIKTVKCTIKQVVEKGAILLEFE